MAAVHDLVSSVAGSLDQFLVPSEELSARLRALLRALFQDGTSALPAGVDCPLSELMVAGFDKEQIWEQLQLYTAPLVEHLESNPPPEDGGSRLEETAGDTDGTNERPEALAETSSDRDPSDAEEQEATSQLASSGEESAGSDGEGESPAGSEGEGESPADSAAARKRPTGLSNQYRGGSRGKANVSAVDDDFFKLSEMKMFLEQEDRAEDLKRAKGDAAAFDDASASSEEEDYLEEMFGEHGADLSGEESEGEAGEEGEAGLAEESDGDVSVPSDFEVSGTGADGKPDEPEEPEGKPASDLFGDDGPSAEAQGLSRYEAEQLRMKRHIQRLEEENVSEKPWQMTGEAAARARPVDSLLQEDLDFEQLTRPAPEVTIETTQSLEDIIIQRIKDQLWDDVERKNTGPDKPFRPKSMQELDQEQNKEGLGEVYAKDFLAQQAGENSAASKAETQLKAKHKEISDLMATLSRKMNALTNFHYTPKPPAEDIEIVTNAPAISMEEVTPATMSKAKGFAPEEVSAKTKAAALLGGTEKTETDRQRERRSKKKRKGMARKEREANERLVEKLNPGMGNKYSKKKALARLEKQSKAGGGVATTIIKDQGGSNRLSSTAFFKQLQEQESNPQGPEKKRSRLPPPGSEVNAASFRL